MRITNRLAGSLLADLLTLGMAGPALADTPATDDAQPTTPAAQTTYDARYAIPAAVPASSEAKVAQWQDMKYAMFIHWGVYSSYAGWYKGQKQEVGYPEQIKAWGHQQTWDQRIPCKASLARSTWPPPKPSKPPTSMRPHGVSRPRTPA